MCPAAQPIRAPGTLKEHHVGGARAQSKPAQAPCCHRDRAGGWLGKGECGDGSPAKLWLIMAGWLARLEVRPPDAPLPELATVSHYACSLALLARQPHPQPQRCTPQCFRYHLSTPTLRLLRACLPAQLTRTLSLYCAEHLPIPGQLRCPCNVTNPKPSSVKLARP